MLITMVTWQPIKGRGEPTGACVRAHSLPPALPRPQKYAQSGGELLRAGCAAWRWLRRRRCAPLLWRAALFRLSSACYEIKSASPSPWVCVRRPAFSLNHLRSALESINSLPPSKTASHFVMERVALRRPHFTAAAGVTGFLFFPACNI